jgi:hypothetical protein
MLGPCFGMTPERGVVPLTCEPALAGDRPGDAVLADLLGQPDENALRASDVAEPVRLFVLNYFVNELGAVVAVPANVLSRSSTANMTRR